MSEYATIEDAEADVRTLVDAYGEALGVGAILAGSIRLYLRGDGTRENMEAALAEWDKRKLQPRNGEPTP